MNRFNKNEKYGQKSMNRILIIVIYSKTCFLLLLIMAASIIARSQDLLDFNAIMSSINNRFEIHDTVSTYDPLHIEYNSTASKSHCQQLIFPGGWKTLYCNESNNKTVYYYEVDSMNRVILYTIQDDIRLTSYTYYPNGKLKCYTQTVEDTLFNNHNIFPLFRYTADSFQHNFHENGTTESIIYYTNGVQNLVTYWPNKQKKIVAEFNANRFLYCGKYKAYDEKGKLCLKGRYYLPEDPLSEPIEVGTWKYYEAGKLKKKQKMPIKHPL